MAVVTITKENFEQEVLQSTDVKVGKVNVDEQPELAGQFGVMSIPTLLVFEQGKLVRQAVDARPKASVLDLLG